MAAKVTPGFFIAGRFGNQEERALPIWQYRVVNRTMWVATGPENGITRTRPRTASRHAVCD